MKNKRLLALFLMTIMVFSCCSVFAGNASLTELNNVILSGDYEALDESDPGDSYSDHQYKTSDGGYLLYTEVVNTDVPSDWIDESKFNKLTAGGKQNFMKDVFKIANRKVQVDEAHGVTAESAVTSETVTEMCDILQNKSGMGSTLMASLLAETKPDYASANKLYKPFSGIVGTALGLISVLIMALLGVSMGLDIAYIVIPAFQMFCGGGDNGSGGNGGKASGVGGLISQEAHWAVNETDGGGGAGGQNGGGHKAAVGIYLKYRWKGLCLLGICLLYLVGGQIYSFVAWFIDLFSGFLGF